MTYTRRVYYVLQAVLQRKWNGKGEISIYINVTWDSSHTTANSAMHKDGLTFEWGLENQFICKLIII